MSFLANFTCNVLRVITLCLLFSDDISRVDAPKQLIGSLMTTDRKLCLGNF